MTNNDNTNFSGTFSKSTEVKVDVGVSRKALSIAREVDRLPPGEFCIILVKHNTKAVPWHTVIHSMNRLKIMDISGNVK